MTLTHPNIPQLFLSQASRLADREALRAKCSGVYSAISWSEFRRQVARISWSLSRHGVKRGGRVALLSENRPEWAFVDLATLGLGAVVVPVYATSSAKEVEYVVSHSGAEILFVSTAEQFEKCRLLLQNCTTLRMIVLFDSPADSNEKWVSLKKFLIDTEGVQLLEIQKFYESKVSDVAPDDLATIIYTSGTTGLPKGVMLSHRNFLINCQDASKAIPMDENDITLSFLPLSHVFERMAGYYYPIQQGATICYAETINTVPQNLLEIRPTVACAVPRLYEKIYSKIMDEIRKKPAFLQRIAAWSIRVGQKVAQLHLSKKNVGLGLRFAHKVADTLVFLPIRRGLGGRLRFFISGGAPLPKILGEFFYAAGVLILEGYGLTETSPVIAVNRPNRLKFGTVGPLFDHVRVKIAGDGEILASGPSVMLGYYENQEATDAVIKDGWFATGDIGELDSEGFLKITDRKKEIIVTSGGKKVSPQNVENLLCGGKWIKQAVVVGDKRNYLVALIVPNLGATEEAVRSEIDELTVTLSNYEKIKYFRLLPKELTIAGGELTPTLKVKRKVVEQQYASLIADMYAEGERKKSS